MASPLNIAFAGLGAMGFGMASHLVKLGCNVTGYDVCEPSLAKFREVGGRTASSPRQAAQGSEFLICMVANAQQAESVLFDSDNGAVQGMLEVSYHTREGTVLTYYSTCPKCNDPVVFHSTRNILKNCPINFGASAERGRPPNR
jgi:3-hydroxyisobutyrate dehydrogenase-like beta-hydroxyacid dehydrogenase